MSNFLVDWYTDIYISSYGYDNTYADVILRFNRYLKQMINANTLQTIQTALWTIGFILMLIFFFTDMTEKAEGHNLSIQQFGKGAAFLVFGAFLTFNARGLFISMLNASERLNSYIQSGNIRTSRDINNFLNNSAVQDLLNRCVNNQFSLIATIGYTMKAAPLMLADWITKLVVMYLCAKRTVELFVYMIFAPVGIADIFQSDAGGALNFNSSGFRYLKRIFSLMLQLVVITAISQSFYIVRNATNAAYVNSMSISNTVEDIKNWAGNLQLPDDLKEQISKGIENAGSWVDTAYNDTILAAKMDSAIKAPLQKFEYTYAMAENIHAGWTILQAEMGDEDYDGGEISPYKENNRTYIPISKFIGTNRSNFGQVTDKEEETRIIADNASAYLFNLANQYSRLSQQQRDSLAAGDDEKAQKAARQQNEITETLKAFGVTPDGIASGYNDLSTMSYRMSVGSTEYFFDYALGANGSKGVLMAVLMLMKAVLIMGAAKITDSLVGL